MRKLIVIAALLSAACSKEEAPDPKKPAEGAEHIACAVDGQAEFADVCAVELAQVDGKRIVVVRHPGGGFRRFEILGDGHGLALADGAETARVVPDGKLLEVTVGADRYRFPYTSKAKAAPDAPKDAPRQ